MPRRIWMLWALFLIRAVFYCVMMPLWEGWDEYAHFAYLDHWIAHRSLPVLEDRMPREIEESLRLAPLPRELRWMGEPHLTHEQWWALPEADRFERLRRLRELPPEFARRPSDNDAVFYEAQQPPLYYWLLSEPLRPIASWPLQHRVLIVRLLSAFVASLTIPLVFFSAPHRPTLAAALLAIAPGFTMDTFRVANDCLAITLFAVLLWLLSRERTNRIAVGFATGAALLTKAYMLVLLPVIAIWWFRTKRDAGLALLLALALGGWWYARNLMLGHSLSGWLEHPSNSAVLAGLYNVAWLPAIGTMAKSFIWFGGWSFLTLKSWMYLLVESLGGVAIGLAVYKHHATLRLPLLACLCYSAAMIYGALVYNADHGGAGLPGWYFWPAAGALAIVLAAAPRALTFSLIVALAAIDLYGTAGLMMPYYAGVTPFNRANIGTPFEAARRLQVPLALVFLWIGATISIVCASCNRMGAHHD